MATLLDGQAVVGTLWLQASRLGPVRTWSAVRWAHRLQLLRAVAGNGPPRVVRTGRARIFSFLTLSYEKRFRGVWFFRGVPAAIPPTCPAYGGVGTVQVSTVRACGGCKGDGRAAATDPFPLVRLARAGCLG